MRWQVPDATSGRGGSMRPGDHRQTRDSGIRGRRLRHMERAADVSVARRFPALHKRNAVASAFPRGQHFRVAISDTARAACDVIAERYDSPCGGAPCAADRIAAAPFAGKRRPGRLLRHRLQCDGPDRCTFVVTNSPDQRSGRRGRPRLAFNRAQAGQWYLRSDLCCRPASDRIDLPIDAEGNGTPGPGS